MIREIGHQLDFNHISDVFTEEEDFFEFLPFSDLKRWTPTDSLLTKASNAFKIRERLHEIRALSFLSYVGPNPEQQYFIGYSHDRLDHSLVVAITAGEIGRLNNLPQKDIDTLEASGLLHDIATSALGDATKSIDPDNLDEERFWQEMVGVEGEIFLAECGISNETVDGIIKNRGMLGQILDIADRITYTMKDLYNVIGDAENKIDIHPYLIELRYPLSHHSQIGNIYKDVLVDQKEDTVFFADSERLGVFLLLRALMHKHLYLEPTSQGRDLFVANLIKPLYSTDGSRPLNPKILRQMGDWELLDFLAEHYQFPRLQNEWFYRQLTNWYPKFEKCENLDEAENKAEKISKRFLVLGIKRCKGFDTGLSYLTLDENQKVVPFKEADPDMAHQIRGIEKDTRATYVFYADVSGDTPINELLRKVHDMMPQSITGHE